MRFASMLLLAGLSCTSSAQLSITEQLFVSPAQLDEQDSFGIAIAIDGGVAAVGAPDLGSAFSGDDALGSVILIDPATGGVLRTITEPTPTLDSYFGVSADLEDDTLAVGAAGFGDFLNIPDPLPGTAYLFRASTGTLIHSLIPSVRHPLQFFGGDIDLGGNRVVVGAELDNEFGLQAGAAFIFDVTTGSETARLLPSDPEAGRVFGRAVAIDGGRVVIGAPGTVDAGNSAGAAYIYDATTGQELFRLAASDARERLFFGTSVAIEGSVAVIGSFEGVYVFDVSTGQQLRRIDRPFGEPTAGFFGVSVEIDGTNIITGANGGGTEGRAYVFDSEGRLIRRLEASIDTGRFGVSVDIDGSEAIVGDEIFGTNDVLNTGAVFLYDYSLGCNPADSAIPFGVLDLEDVNQFIIAFNGGDLAADLTLPIGILDLEDVNAFIDAFLAGCP